MNRSTMSIVLSALLLAMASAAASEVAGSGGKSDSRVIIAAAEADVKAELVMPDPKPKPKDLWNTIMTEKPVRLEGASFATGSAQLLRTAEDKLNQVVDVAKQHPNVRLEVSGHTDDKGSREANQNLSENRAAAVKAYLVSKGVAADRIVAAGYADTQPITDNKTEIGRAANRRVEVRYEVMEEMKVRVIQ